MVSKRLYDLLGERGYVGSQRILRRHVRLVRPGEKAEAVLRGEPLAGEQAQVDWAHVGKIAVPGGRRTLGIFVMVLAHSNTNFAAPVFSLDIHSLSRSFLRAAMEFEQLPRQ